MRRLLVVQNDPRVPLGRLRFPGLAVDVVRPYRGDSPPDRIPDHAGLIVLGGTMAAWEDDIAPWLPATRDLLARCVDDGTPVLGVCLGAQLLALATGGRVERGPAGPELGVVNVERTAASDGDALLGGLPAVFAAASGHHDAVTELADDAVELARTQMYPHQAFRLGTRAWGVQYHPEATAPVLADWLESDRAVLAARGTTPERLVAEFGRRDAELAGVCRAHAEAFTAVVASRFDWTAHVG